MARRGRPRLWGDRGYAEMRALYPFISDRHLRNMMHQSHAIGAIQDDPELMQYFVPEPRPKTMILVELGKFEDEDVIRELARQVMVDARNDKSKSIQEILQLIRRRPEAFSEAASEIQREVES